MTNHAPHDARTTGAPPVRPSFIFWLLLAVTVGLGAFLASFGSDGFDDRGFFAPDLNIRLGIFAFVAAGWLLSLTLHEFGHALMAWFGGDFTVKGKGYLDLDPRKYTDPGLSLLLPMVFVMLGGIGLPGGAVWIQTSLIRRPWALSRMSAAGPTVNAVFAAACLLPLTFDVVTTGNATALAVGLGFLGFLQVSAAVLNLIPIPGFDGYGIISPHLAPELDARLRPLGRNGLFILIALLWFVPPANDAFWGSVLWIYGLFGAEEALVREGFDAFQFWR